MDGRNRTHAVPDTAGRRMGMLIEVPFLLIRGFLAEIKKNPKVGTVLPFFLQQDRPL